MMESAGAAIQDATDAVHRHSPAAEPPIGESLRYGARFVTHGPGFSFGQFAKTVVR